MSYDPIECDVCSGNGLPPGNMLDPETRNVVPCVCWSKRVPFWALEKANLYRKYIGATFTLFPNEKFINQEEVVGACRAYVDDWNNVKKSGRCLSILGSEPGMGKSHLASAICQHLLTNYWTVSVSRQDVCFFVNVNSWLSDWAHLYNRFASENDRKSEEFHSERKVLGERENRMVTTELLVLDDLTKFNTQDQDKVQKIFGVIEKRVIQGLPIVVTENADSWDRVSAKLGAMHGKMIVDRLMRNGDTLFVRIPENKRGKKKS